MYLSVERGFYPSDDVSNEHLRNVAEVAKMGNLLASDLPSAQVAVTCIYWRKANMVHRWFVENVQEGKDDCRRYEVQRQQLVKLREICTQLLEDRTLVAVAEHLPPQPGFFFGSTEVDDWYWQDVEHTAQALQRVLDETDEASENFLDGFTFYYESSW